VKKLVSAAICVGISLLFTIGAFLQGSQKREGDILFNMSPSSFYESKPKTRLEVYYEIPYEQLSFTKEDTLADVRIFIQRPEGGGSGQGLRQ